MSLTVTVQKGHDFSSGNETRAALNAGAVPTVAVTGSVGTSELAAGSVTGTELKSSSTVDADRAVATNHIQDDAVTTAKIADDAVDLTKLHYSTAKGALIKIGDTALDDGVMIPEVLETKLEGKILIGDGVDLLSLGHETADEENGDTTLNQPKSHVAIGVTTAVSPSPTTGVLLTLKDFAIKVAKLAKNVVATVATPGIIVYDQDGVASVLASTGTAGRVLTTNDTSTPSFQAPKISNKIVPLLGAGGRTTFGTAGGESTARTLLGAHGVDSPKAVSIYLEVIAGETDLGYAAGDKIPLLQNMINTHYNTVVWDSANVICQFVYAPYIYNKTSTAQDSIGAASYISVEKWKVIALVSE